MDYFIGSIIPWTPNFAPDGWAFCNGSILYIRDHTALFTVINTIYGGDGISTFALPNLCGRVIVGADNPGIPGEFAGFENVALAPNQMPSHTHDLKGNTNSNTPGVNYPDTTRGLGIVKTGLRTINMYNQKTSDVGDMESFTPASILHSGGNQAHSNLQPYQVTNYIICMKGVYPQKP